MKQYLKVAFILFAICAVAALLLGVVNSITAPIIAANTARETEEALLAVSGGYALGERESGEGTMNYVIPLLEGSEVKGYIIELTGNGYGGEFTLIASYNSDGSVITAKMMSNSETPGLGKKSEESWYMEQFVGLGGERSLPASKQDLPDPSAVSGASVTFNAVRGAIQTGSDYVKQRGGV